MDFHWGIFLLTVAWIFIEEFSFTVFGKIWVVAEDTLASLKINGGKVTIVDKYFGFASLTKDVETGVFPLQEVRALVVLMGRAEAFSRGADFLGEALGLIQMVQQKREKVVIYFGGPFPRGKVDA